MSVPVIPILAVGAGVAAVAVGAQFAFGKKNAVTQGGSPWGGPVNAWLARRSVIGFGVKETLLGGSPTHIGERWKRVTTMQRAEADVRGMENAVFYLGAKQVGKKLLIGYDNGPDAFR
ncbi:MAG: hypothetical protein JWM98_3369, partial [Thermoleophilia bacterium]|nr:hypothetical protein [Thermoleophilia bacterium]